MNKITYISLGINQLKLTLLLSFLAMGAGTIGSAFKIFYPKAHQIYEDFRHDMREARDKTEGLVKQQMKEIGIKWVNQINENLDVNEEDLYVLVEGTLDNTIHHLERVFMLDRYLNYMRRLCKRITYILLFFGICWIAVAFVQLSLSIQGLIIVMSGFIILFVFPLGYGGWCFWVLGDRERKLEDGLEDIIGRRITKA